MNDSERLAAWYLRLTGYLTIPAFILHRSGGGQRTEVDVIGVRFPHRDEFGVGDVDDDALGYSRDCVHVILAEVKLADAQLNETWTNASKGNIHGILQAIGFVPKEDVGDVAEQLCREGRATYRTMTFSLAAIGETQSLSLRDQYPAVPFRSHIPEFIPA